MAFKKNSTAKDYSFSAYSMNRFSE